MLNHAFLLLVILLVLPPRLDHNGGALNRTCTASWGFLTRLKYLTAAIQAMVMIKSTKISPR